jgi:hypothetical protein
VSQNHQGRGTDQQYGTDVFLDNHVVVGSVRQNQSDDVLKEDSVLSMLAPQHSKSKGARVRVLNQADVELLIRPHHVDRVRRNQPEIKRDRDQEPKARQPEDKRGSRCLAASHDAKRNVKFRTPRQLNIAAENDKAILAGASSFGAPLGAPTLKGHQSEQSNRPDEERARAVNAVAASARSVRHQTPVLPLAIGVHPWHSEEGHQASAVARRELLVAGLSRSPYALWR